MTPDDASTVVGPAPAAVELIVGPVAHGGHCVARLDGRVVFVRHALPGERVLARLTDAAPDAAFWRADVTQVMDASPDRVPPAWPAAGPGGVGGGELSHVALPAQRTWKAAVVREQMTRLAGLDPPISVHAAPGDDDRGGLGWRTRISLVADRRGRAGMYRHRSHDVLALDAMPLASEQVAALDLFTRTWPRGGRIDVAAPASGDRPVVLVDGVPWTSSGPDVRPNARTAVREELTVTGRTYRYRMAAAGFWQVHRQAPAVLAGAVLDAIGDVRGATVVELFAGAGLLTAPLADAVGTTGRVIAVEGDARAVHDARRLLHQAPQVQLHHGPVRQVLADEGPTGADVVVLDPPRTGAGRAVVDQIGRLRPARIVYVACDPAALARDVSTLAGHGYGVTTLDAYDLFPHTHHVECVAVLDR